MTAAPGITFAGTGAYLPERVVTNEELASRLDTSDVWILERTGIAERRIASPEQSTSDLGIAAAEQALEASGLEADGVDLLICATSSPDWIQPATAAAIHRGLGMTRAGAMDVNVVCSGFVYALHAGAAMLAAEPHWQHVLVVGAECYSRIVNQDDRRTAVLFGDGAGALVLRRQEGAAGAILHSQIGNDSTQLDALIVPAGGAREPATEEALSLGRTYFAMDGPAVRQYAQAQMPSAVRAVCDEAGISPRQLDLIVPHQSNRRIMEACIEELEMTEQQVHFTVERYGNTAAASIPITLDDAARSGRLQGGELVCLVGYGGGLSWGSMLVRWPKLG